MHVACDASLFVVMVLCLLSCNRWLLSTCERARKTALMSLQRRLERSDRSRDQSLNIKPRDAQAFPQSGERWEGQARGIQARLRR